MKTFASFGVLIVGLYVGALAQRNLTAHPYQTAVGSVEKNSPQRVVVNRNPCADAKYITFSGNFKVKSLGVRTCNNGKTYEAFQVTQCGGDHDQKDAVCKSS